MLSSKTFVACEDGGDSWRYSFRPCCESVFLTVFHEFRETLAPALVQIVHQSCGPVGPNDLAAILHKDAIYNAVGLAAFDLYDEVISTAPVALTPFFLLGLRELVAYIINT